ncbi:MAG: type 4a pilus biogenesis protein PilO [Candidatus Pacebacteria bacterium]|nr:type 4a pilus biogenesis protein PilO [Candidatus Paceibacterota bacterium]
MKLTNFQQMLIKVTAPYLGAILILIVVIFVVKGNINSNVKKINLDRTVINSQVESLKALADLRSEYEEASPNFSFLENILPSRDEILIFSKDMETLAKNDQLGFGFTFGSETKSTPVAPGSIAFRMAIQGPYSNLITFLKDVEKSRYLVDFVNFNLSKRGDSYDADISGLVFTR